MPLGWGLWRLPSAGPALDPACIGLLTAAGPYFRNAAAFLDSLINSIHAVYIDGTDLELIPMVS